MSTRDGIADPWGRRTPYGPGEPWPVRVDAHLADGLTEDDIDAWVPTAAVLHSNGDGLDLAVRDGRIVGSGAGRGTGSTGVGSTRRTRSAGRPTTRRTG